MVLTINRKSGLIRDYPLNIVNHRVLGKDLEIYVEDVEESEEDKTVIEKRVYRKKSEPISDVESEESIVTIDEAGE